MTPEQLVIGIQEELIERTYESYRTAYEQPESSTKATRFFQKLTDREREVFFHIIRQTQVDVVATFLALLDGNILFRDQSEDLYLAVVNKPSEKLNGDLTDIFLAQNYQWER